MALTVSATLAAALSTTLYTAFRARSSAQHAIEAARSLDAIGEIVGRDISTALPPTGLMASAFLGDATTLDFYCTGGEQGAAIQGGCRRVQYGLSETDQHSLVRRVYTNLLAPVEVEPKEEQVCGGVASLQLEYYDGDSWYDTWDSTQHSDTLPVAVRVTLSLLADAGNADSAQSEVSRLIPLPCGVTASALESASAGVTQ